MRTLTSFFLTGVRRLSWLAFPIFLFVAVQASSLPFREALHPLITAVMPAPQAVTVTAGSNGPLCAGATLNLTATITDGTPPFAYAWSGPAGFSSPAQNPSRPNTTLAHAGTYTVTVTDDTGMSATATVAVQINQPATADAGPDKVLCTGTPHQLNGSIGGAATSATWTASVMGGSFTPNPQMLNAQYNPPANYQGTITLTLTTNDPPGPCPAVSDQMLLTYGTPGALVCNDTVFIAMPQTCSVVVTPDMALEQDVLDDLYTVTLFTPQGQNIGNTITSQYVGIPLTIRVQDNCSGNFCITIAIASDNLPPQFLSCQNITVPCVVNKYTPAYLRDTLGISAAFPTVVDNCTTPTLTFNDTWVDVPCGGVFNGINNLSGYIVRVWTATDLYGNKSTCTQYVYFQRLNINDLTLPANVTVNCDMPMTNPAVTGAPSYTFNGVTFYINGTNTFCEINATATDQIAPSCDGRYAILRTWQLFNLCNASQPLVHLQAINVVDPQGPAIACPGNLSVSTDPLACCATVDLPDVIMEDACGRVRDAAATIFVRNPITGDTIATETIPGTLVNFPGNDPNKNDTLAVFGFTPCLPIGQHIVMYFAEDACGVSNSCTFILTVTDLVPPTVACDEITQVTLGIDGMALINASTFDDGSYDNCGPVYFKARRLETNSCQANSQFLDQVKFCCEDVGDTVKVILRVYDVPLPAGPVSLSFQEQRSNECEVQVYIDDKLRPVCLAPANTTVDCENYDPSLWAYGMATGADNCCVDTVFTSAVNWSQFDTMCSRGTITRTFQVRDCHGLTSTCTQRIVVAYKQNYFVRFPDDVIITSCNGSGDYGAPQFFGEDCELLGVSYTDQLFTVVPDACYKIERTWTVINWCSYNPNLGCTVVPNPNPNAQSNHPSNLAGPVVSPVGTLFPWAPTVAKLDPNDAQAVNFSTYWSPNVNCYQYKQLIKITDTQKPVMQCPSGLVDVCDLTDNDPNLWNQSYWYDPKTFSHNLCEGPADLCITATDDCSKSNVTFRYQLFLDLDGNGSMETVINSLTAEPNVVYFNNAGNPNFTGGIARAFDKRSVPFDQKYRFALETNVSGNSKIACVRWNTVAQPNTYVVPELPYGTHKIKWFVSDGCGNEQVCEYTFVIKDCKAPSTKCVNGLSGNIGPDKLITVNASLFVLDVEENCTPKNLIVHAIRKKGQGTGFPLLTNGSPQTSVSFDCTELGFQLVEVWSRDLAGNADFCETFFHVQNNDNNCSTSHASVAGAVLTPQGHGLEEANVQITCQAINGAPPITKHDMTDLNGHYQFNNSIPIAINYTITPVKDNDPLNGVSTFDLVLINRHILGYEPLTSPYKMIAADVNNNGSITTFDLVELRKLILGIYSDFPDNTSWRFVDKAYQFPVPSNPWTEIFPESKSVWNFQTNNVNDDFVAIKIGDVNTTSIANSALYTEERSAGTLLFDVDDRFVKPGEHFTATFTAAEQVQAFQFTLNYTGLDIEDLVPGPGMGEDNFAIFPDKHALTASVQVPHAADRATFQVRFRATAAGQLSQMLNLSSRITRSEAYPDEHGLEKHDIALRFHNGGEQTVTGIGFELYQNVPNPWVNKTQIGFYLPQAADATLTIFDDLGRAVFTETADYNRGYNAIFIEHALLDKPGVLYYTLETPYGKATRKMIQAK